ncbi:adhesin [Vibrio gigantis]|uniref:Adhesin n=1 Tax=Vibrio gigantis TaxID=296199 RepID=A0A5M9NHF9_9VIBR|nr:adhesin [Vibrio gigantis]
MIRNNALYLVDNVDILETHAVFHAMTYVFQA